MRLATASAAPANAAVTKPELRAQILAELRDAARTPALRHADSKAICAAIRQHPAWSKARVICGFLPLSSEPQIAALWEEDRAFCFPRIRSGAVELIRLAHPEMRRRATWKLEGAEHDDAPLVAPAEVDLFLVPGLAFTPDGRRLGRGAGFYDRLLLHRSASSVVLGVCFAAQLVAVLPWETHDQKVDAVITERGGAGIDSR
jgi:5-formyltetrahydrofolate cyclo-ligase